MPGRGRRAKSVDTDDVRWLTADQQAAWLALAKLLVYLPWAVECQLQEDADLSLMEYHVLAMLSETPDHTRRMSELAATANASLSRLSHLVKRLEAREFVRREPDPDDGRYTNAILTDAGYRHLVASAPGHVARVRELVIDALSATELRQLHGAVQRILDRVEPAPPS